MSRTMPACSNSDTLIRTPRFGGYAAFRRSLRKLLRRNGIGHGFKVARPIVLAAGSSGEQPHPAVEKARRFMDAHYGEKIDLERLAELSRVSAFYFHRLFRREEGVTPRTYLEKLRIDKARALLEQGGNLAQTALDTGFYDQSHFANTFRKITGLTPGEYRKIFQDKYA